MRALRTSSWVFVVSIPLVAGGVLLGGCGDTSATTQGTGASGTAGPSGSGSTGVTSGTSSTSSSSTGSGSPDVDCTAAEGSVPGLALTLVTDQLTQPIQAKSAPDDPDRIYVAQKSGEIMIIENGQLLPTPFLDISNLVDDDGPTGEQGLLGIAFHPDYKTNGRFFVHFSSAQNGDDSTVMEFKRSASDPHVADPTPVQLVLEHPTAQGNHNGGAVEFGPDGYLYVSLGDGGNQGDPECDAQLDGPGDPAVTGVNLLGKISRLDVNATPDANGYPAAQGNPNGLKSYHRGFRNPWRISFDPCSGDLYVGDVGQDMYEEVDRIPASSGPINGGWPYREGTHDYDPNHANCPPNPGGFVEPITDYSHNSGCSVTGGYVYRSSAIPSLRGAYFFADYCSGHIFYVAGGGGAPVQTELDPGGNVLGAFGYDGRGNVYVATLSGELYRIDQM